MDFDAAVDGNRSQLLNIQHRYPSSPFRFAAPAFVSTMFARMQKGDGFTRRREGAKEAVSPAPFRRRRK
jgi:hypothetical protein